MTEIPNNNGQGPQKDAASKKFGKSSSLTRAAKEELIRLRKWAPPTLDGIRRTKAFLEGRSSVQPGGQKTPEGRPVWSRKQP